MGNEIIFAYSIDNKYYKGDMFKNAINSIPERFQNISFLIADKIQLYNIAKKKTNLISSLKQYDSKEFFLRSKNFILSFDDKVNIDLSLCKFMSISDFYDKEYIEIFRKILVAYELDTKFSEDVNEQIEAYLFDKKFSEKHFNFSRLYILEEIALNIRMKQVTKSLSEYYIGHFANSVVWIYRNKYSFTYNDFQTKESNLNEFHFYEFDFNDLSWNRK